MGPGLLRAEPADPSGHRPTFAARRWAPSTHCAPPWRYRLAAAEPRPEAPSLGLPQEPARQQVRPRLHFSVDSHCLFR